MWSNNLPLRVFAVTFVLLAAPEHGPAHAAQTQQPHALLSERVDSYSARGLRLEDALLRLGAQEGIPLGLEYVSREGVEKPVNADFHGATVGHILERLLAGRGGYTWEVRGGVLDISQKSVSASKENLLNCVLPEFVIRRCTVADASNALYMTLNTRLHPEITGYAGDYNPGDIRNLVGPLNLRNPSVREVLNLLVNADKKGAWIVRAQPGSLGQLPPGGFWTIIQYQHPPKE